MDFNQLLLAVVEAAHQAASAAPDAAHAAASSAPAAAAHADTGLLGTLGINLKLFIAQLVNFGIVLFVFWKWVVGPLGKALTERQDRIESGLKNAAYMEEEKAKFEAWKSGQMKAARADAERIIKDATETSEKVRQEISASTQEQAAKMIDQAKAAIAQERDQAMRQARAEMAELVVMASEKVIKAKLDAVKDRNLVADAVKGLE